MRTVRYNSIVFCILLFMLVSWYVLADFERTQYISHHTGKGQKDVMTFIVTPQFLFVTITAVLLI
ncbi:hypothetical protein GCM10011378_02790 [Hymenobacter glacieicola]|uniref:Uncharacterized protein n=1 Tax=Hymenobacter glacieicola TaxID=1562124 RepID=A0ABQ1WGE2_9BACT|nr:hypothetical protein GCM10011378_02790 [Hymenobacter glacieicola]